MERIDQEAAKRERQFEREAAKRERRGRFEREAAKRERQFEREAAKREEAIRALMDRSDRKFEALLAQSVELSRQLAEMTGRVLRTEAVLETMQAGGQRAAVQPAPATGETEWWQRREFLAVGLPNERWRTRLGRRVRQGHAERTVRTGRPLRQASSVLRR